MSRAHGGGRVHFLRASVTPGRPGRAKERMADDGEHEPSRTVGQGPTGSRPLFESPAQIVGAALGSAAVVGFLLAHSVQYGVAVLVALLFLPIALLNLPLAIGLFVPLIYLEQVPGAARIPSGVALLIFMAWLGTLAGRGSLFAEVFKRHRGMYLLLLMLMAWITVSLLWARDPGVAAGGLWQWYWAAGIVLVIPTALWTRRHVVVVCVGLSRRADRRDDHPAADLLGIVDGLCGPTVAT